MSRRYLGLAFAVLAGIVAVSVLARSPRHRERPVPEPAPVPVVALTLVLEGGALEPETAAVPKDHRVRLTVVNRESGPHSFRLAGYEDRVALAALAPGASWSDSFLADRPGEAFAWLVDDKPLGRLSVTGSHLEEGHR